MVKMAFRQFSPEGYLGPADRFHEYGTGPFPQYTAEDYEQQQATNPSTLPRTLPGSGRGLADLLKGLPRGSGNRGGFTGVLEGKEGVDIDPDFFQSDFYKTYNDPKYTSGPQTMDMRFSKYFDVGGDQRHLDSAYNRFLNARDSGEPVQIPDPITQDNFSPQPSSPQIDISKYRNLFNQNRFRQPQPFMGQMGGMFGFPFGSMMGGYGRSPMMGGFGGFGGFGRSPFGGLGMFGMSPYGGMPNYGMFGGMMSPYMGGMGGMFGGGGMNRPPAQPVPRPGGIPPQQSTYYQGSAFTPNFQPSMGSQSTQQPPNMNNQPTQQPFQSPNPFMNPFMSGLGSMMGGMFGGGYGSNVSNTQANVAQ
jgi:hypothetical protein